MLLPHRSQFVHAWAILYTLHFDVYPIKLNCFYQVDNPNILGNTPLHVACYNGQDVVIEELINNGANVNAANIKGLVSIVRTIFCKLKYRTGQKF